MLFAAASAAAGQVVATVMKASGKIRRRYSAHIFAHAILHWYSTTKQMPRGISPNCASVRDWALRTGTALRKLVSLMHELTINVCLDTLNDCMRV